MSIPPAILGPLSDENAHPFLFLGFRCEADNTRTVIDRLQRVFHQIVHHAPELVVVGINGRQDMAHLDFEGDAALAGFLLPRGHDLAEKCGQVEIPQLQPLLARELLELPQRVDADDRIPCRVENCLPADFLKLERSERLRRRRHATLARVCSLGGTRSAADVSSVCGPAPRRSGGPPDLAAWLACSTPESPGQCMPVQRPTR